MNGFKSNKIDTTPTVWWARPTIYGPCICSVLTGQPGSPICPACLAKELDQSASI